MAAIKDLQHDNVIEKIESVKKVPIKLYSTRAIFERHEYAVQT